MMLREALTNVVRHAGATRVRVAMAVDDDGLSLEVVDDGKGFDPDHARPGGNGLRNLRKRAASSGLELTMESGVGKGTRITIHLPWKNTGQN